MAETQKKNTGSFLRSRATESLTRQNAAGGESSFRVCLKSPPRPEKVMARKTVLQTSTCGRTVRAVQTFLRGGFDSSTVRPPFFWSIHEKNLVAPFLVNFQSRRVPALLESRNESEKNRIEVLRRGCLCGRHFDRASHQMSLRGGHDLSCRCRCRSCIDLLMGWVWMCGRPRKISATEVYFRLVATRKSLKQSASSVLPNSD